MKYNYSQPTSNIQIISPNGGELWEIGSTKQITWNSTEINYVNIEYSYNNGLSWNTVVSSYPNSNVYNWTVPNIMTHKETNNSEFNVQRSVISGEGKNFEWQPEGGPQPH
ncbi:MAG: hypothetical protein IPI19_17280 [Ignavibacteriales bacterium]|nr:hypothetical protein [Ignavibacteriales bacterium]